MSLLPVVFPDVQLLVVDYLRPILGALNPTVAVHIKVPAARPPRFVTVRRSGGTASGVLDHPLVDIFAWAPTDQEAHDLGPLVRAHLANMPAQAGGRQVKSVSDYAGLAPAPDSSGVPRWMFSLEITTRGVRL